MIDENNVVVNENDGNGTKVLTFDELLGSNKEYQSEFDRRLAKSNKTALENAKTTWEKEFTEKLEREKSEAEKLAKMNVEQQLQYRIDQLEKELNESKSRNTANELRETTSNILNDKGIPTSYLNVFDFSNETADTINKKIEMLSEIREKDLEASLNVSLRQKSPKQVMNEPYEIDPFVEGFMSEL